MQSPKARWRLTSHALYYKIPYIGVGGPENGNFPLLYVVKMSLRRWVVQKSLKTPLHKDGSLQKSGREEIDFFLGKVETSKIIHIAE